MFFRDTHHGNLHLCLQICPNVLVGLAASLAGGKIERVLGRLEYHPNGDGVKEGTYLCARRCILILSVQLNVFFVTLHLLRAEALECGEQGKKRSNQLNGLLLMRKGITFFAKSGGNNIAGNFNMSPAWSKGRSVPFLFFHGGWKCPY